MSDDLERFTEILIDKDNKSSIDEQRDAAWRLGRIKDERAVEPLISVFFGERRDLRVLQEASWAIEEIGQSAIGHLIRKLKNRFPISVIPRRRLIKTLALLVPPEDERLIEPLLGVLEHAFKDSEDSVRVETLTGFGKLALAGNPRAIEILRTATREKDETIRMIAKDVLQKII